MKNTWRVTLFLILALVLIPGLAAAAQPPDPALAGPQAEPALPGDSSELRLLRQRAPDAGRATTALGQPGASYRYAATFGQTQTPYLIDTQHLNRPIGLATDAAGYIYVVDERGFRVVKFDDAGQSRLVLGAPGQPWPFGAFLAFPQDAAVDAEGAIWVAFEHGVKQVDRFGVLLQTLPADSPSAPGSSNTRFRYPRGVALDGAGKLYVSDMGNHRVQVYDVSGGAPVYQATIGVTGVAGSDAGHFNLPAHIALDSSGRLYVADEGNSRVQRCTQVTAHANAPEATWTCSTFHGSGAVGSGANQLAAALGVDVDGAGNVFIADSGNGRVKQCTAAGSCTIFASGLGNPSDVAASPDGMIYVSDWDRNVVYRFAAGGSGQAVFAGVTGTPYATNGSHFNSPAGVGAAADGGLYVLENLGYRLLKLDAAGQLLWSVGQAGIPGADNAHFGNIWQGPQGNLAVDTAGRVYVPDTGNHRIQVFNANGAFQRSFGSQGAGNSQLSCPTGVAISPANGDILVADYCNERVQVFDSAWNYKATLGITGTAGASLRHFNSPSGVAIDATGAIYVADTDNYRVQRCTLSGSNYACTTFAGETGVFSGSFSHLHPVAVAVDAAGRVIVADQRNNRVQVFDRSGNYLTTLGGVWGPGTGNLRRPAAVVVDAAGALLVADQDNQRVQRYLMGVPAWSQFNLNGFGDLANSLVLSLASFGGRLYAGTDNAGSGGQIWRLDSTGAWSAVVDDGFGDPANGGIDHLLPFNGQLYAGTWNWNGASNSSNGGQVWRSANGSDWTRVVNNGFGDAGNDEVFRFEVFDGQLYASTWSYSAAHGAEIWRSPSGNAGSWTRVAANGFGDNQNEAIISFAVFGGQLYAGTINEVTGGQIWRSADGVTWSPVNAAGFGFSSNWAISALAAFDGSLYASVRDGGQVWRCQVCDGSDWQRVVDAGFGNATTNKASALAVMDGALYLVIGNYSTGLEVWRTQDGSAWQQVGFAGLGDSNNRAPYWDNSVLAAGSQLLVGTWNLGNGGELWSYQPRSVYLPVGIR